MQDSLRRFLFEHTPIRGEIVHLDQTWRAVLERHNYPPVLRKLLGELMAAAALLAATLKLKGSLILQIQGNGPVSLLVVECTGELAMRATAKWKEELPEGSVADLIGGGRFAITLDPKDGKQAYQGIVALEGNSIAEILQNYMLRSEQLDTQLQLAADDQAAGGILLQKLPGQTPAEDDTWNRAGQFIATLSPRELLDLPAEALLHRLFHEDDIRLFKPQSVTFRCTCSRDSVTSMLKMLGREEVSSILDERGIIEVSCEFCNQQYRFDLEDTEKIFTAAIVVPGTTTRH